MAVDTPIQVVPDRLDGDHDVIEPLALAASHSACASARTSSATPSFRP